MTWRVELAARDENPDEYLGLGQREALDENGNPVTMWIGAVVDGRELRAWLGLGVVKCSGRYRREGITTGACAEMGGNPVGAFRASRVPSEAAPTLK
jgi:hypothetical protein